MKKFLKKFSVMSVCFYVIALLLVIYGVWAMIETNTYISDGVSSGQFVKKGNEFNILTLYITSGGVYIIYALILTGLGALLMKPSKKEVTMDMVAEDEEKDTNFTVEVKEETPEEEIV